jgi:hypothetical protein
MNPAHNHHQPQLAQPQPTAKSRRLRAHRLKTPDQQPRLIMVVIAMAVFVVTGAAIVLHSHAATRPIGKLSPASGAYWGIYTASGIASRETAVGRKFAIQQKYYDWTNNFPGASETDDVANNRIPLITWQPQTNSTTPLSASTDSDIAAGLYDTNIIAHAQAIKQFGHPVFFTLRPRDEWQLVPLGRGGQR